eukprot:gene15406-17239_t
MLPSGPRSYYDEYMRKKGSQRILQDPASLLTDRGAYVNFLEVQLERVSAACLTAQTYEDRFNDVNVMIKALEQRCASNVKLIALAQQCTEEVRAEADHKLDIVMKRQQEYEKQTDKSLHILQQQESGLERAVTAIPVLDARVLTNERSIIEHEQRNEERHEEAMRSIIEHEQRNEERHEEAMVLVQGLQKAHDEMETTSLDLSQRIHQNSQNIHELRYDVTGLQESMRQFQTAIEQRVKEVQEEVTRSLSSQLQTSENALTEKIHDLDSVVQRYQLDNISLVKNQYHVIATDLSTLQHLLEEEIQQCRSDLTDALIERTEQSHKLLETKIEDVSVIQAEQLTSLHSLEEEVIRFFENTDVISQTLQEKMNQVEVALTHAQDLHEKQLLFLHQQYESLRRDMGMDDVRSKDMSNQSVRRLFSSMSRSRSFEDGSRSAGIPPSYDPVFVASSVSSVGATRGRSSDVSRRLPTSVGPARRSRSHDDSYLSSHGMTRSFTLEDMDDVTRKTATSVPSLPSHNNNNKRKKKKEKKSASKVTSLSDSEVMVRKSSIFPSSANTSVAETRMSKRSALKKIPSFVSFDLSGNEYVSPPHPATTSSTGVSRSTSEDTISTVRHSLGDLSGRIARTLSREKVEEQQDEQGGDNEEEDEKEERRSIMSYKSNRSLKSSQSASNKSERRSVSDISEVKEDNEGEENKSLRSTSSSKKTKTKDEDSEARYEEDREEIFERLDEMYRKVLEAAQASHSHSLSQKKKTAKGKSSRSPSPALLRGSGGDVSGRAGVGVGLGVGYDDLEEYLRKNFPNSALYRSMSQSQQNDLHPSPWRPPNTYQKPPPRHSTSPSTIPVNTPHTSYNSLSTSLPLTTARYAPLVTRNQATSTSQPL